MTYLPDVQMFFEQHKRVINAAICLRRGYIISFDRTHLGQGTVVIQRLYGLGLGIFVSDGSAIHGWISECLQSRRSQSVLGP